MPDRALPTSGYRGHRINPTYVLRSSQSGAPRLHVTPTGRSFTFYDINKGDYKP